MSNVEAICSICHDHIYPANTIRSCGNSHTFHSLCIDEWLQFKQSCPDCRAEMVLEMQAVSAEVLSLVNTAFASSTRALLLVSQARSVTQTTFESAVAALAEIVSLLKLTSESCEVIQLAAKKSRSADELAGEARDVVTYAKVHASHAKQLAEYATRSAERSEVLAVDARILVASHSLDIYAADFASAWAKCAEEQAEAAIINIARAEAKAAAANELLVTASMLVDRVKLILEQRYMLLF